MSAYLIIMVKAYPPAHTELCKIRKVLFQKMAASGIDKYIAVFFMLGKVYVYRQSTLSLTAPAEKLTVIYFLLTAGILLEADDLIHYKHSVFQLRQTQQAFIHDKKNF